MHALQTSDKSKASILFTVLICGLGYFVDIYDLILFSVVRVESLTGIGIPPEEVLFVGESILRSQMIGMLLGGILFGILADKRGRLSILLGSILLYSLMSIANAFVSSASLYAVLRFFSGIGLAGELGVAVTLVAEIMPKASRGYGTTIVAAMGILGAVWAFAVHTMFDWRAAYVVGGVMGLVLLVLRVRVQESGMFRRSEAVPVSRGNMLMLFSPKRLLLYVSCITIGVPIWYIVGILVSFSPEFSREGGSVGTVVAGQSIMWAYVGLAAGDLASGVISQWIKSRRLSILFFLLISGTASWWYLATTNKSEALTYLQCSMLGFTAGYWAVFVTTSAEQFGTNLRATVATTVPNFVRGALAPALLAFRFFATGGLPEVGAVYENRPLASSAFIVGVFTFAVAIVGWMFLRESYGKELEYLET